MLVIIGILQVDTSDKFKVCEQQWVVYTLGNSFKINLAASFVNDFILGAPS